MTVNSKERKSTAFSVRGYFKTSVLENSLHLTTLECKKIVSRAQRTPVAAQNWYFCGVELDDNTTLSDAGVKNGSTIIMTVLPQFVERVHPYEYADVLTNKIMSNPIECTDRYTYDGDTLDMWEGSLHGQPLTSPMTRENIRRKGTHDALQQKIEAYIENFDVTRPADYLSLSRLGRLQTILGHLSHVVGPIPRNAIPHIVSIGGESIGKSVTLESITMMPIFPFGPNRCTRMPVEIRYRRGPAQLPVLRVIRGSGMNPDLGEAEEDARENSAEDCVYRDTIAIEGARGQMQQQMSVFMDRVSRSFENSDEAPGVSNDYYMVLDLVGESYPDLNMTDFPGLASNDLEIIQEMMRNHFRRHGNRSIYLHMTKASQFIEDGPFRIFDEALLERAVSLVTHADMAGSIPDHPNRLEQLHDLCNGILYPEAAALGDHVLPNGNFVAMNKEDVEKDDPSGKQPIYNRRERANELFSSPPWTTRPGLSGREIGIDGVIKRMHRMYFLSLEESYIPHALCSIQAHEAEQYRLNTELGLPAVVSTLPPREHKALLEEVINGFINTLQDNLPAILSKFDYEHIQPLEEELNAILTSPDFQLVERLHAQDIITETGQTIMSIFEAHVVSHMQFWLDESERALLEDASVMKLGRFVDARTTFREHLTAKLEVAFGRIDESVIAFLAKEALNVRVSPVRGIEEEYAVPMVRLTFNTDFETLAHIMCDSMRDFANIISNPVELESCMEECPLIEECIDDRMAIRNELLLCRLATIDILKLAHRFKSVKSLLPPRGKISLVHPKTKSILQVTRSAEGGEPIVQTRACRDDFDADNCCEITGHKWEQFEVVDMGNGEVGFHCPAFPGRYLCVSADGFLMTMTNEVGDNFDAALKFKAEFHSESSSSSSPSASRSVNLCNKGRGSFVKVAAATSDSGETFRVVSASSSSMSADKMDEMFVVVSNPEQY